MSSTSSIYESIIITDPAETPLTNDPEIICFSKYGSIASHNDKGVHTTGDGVPTRYWEIEILYAAN